MPRRVRVACLVLALLSVAALVCGGMAAPSFVSSYYFPQRRLRTDNRRIAQSVSDLQDAIATSEATPIALVLCKDLSSSECLDAFDAVNKWTTEQMFKIPLWGIQLDNNADAALQSAALAMLHQLRHDNPAQIGPVSFIAVNHRDQFKLAHNLDELTSAALPQFMGWGWETH